MSGAEIDGQWRQGSLLPASVIVPTLQWVEPSSPETKLGRKTVQAERRASGEDPRGLLVGIGGRKDSERVIVLTQTCDLIKPADALPQLEVARVFATGNERTIAQAQDFGSSRYYRLDSGDGDATVLDYGHRALAEKGFLRAYEPDNALIAAWDEADQERFVRWLGQRYARPAIPDEDYELITRPVRDAWKSLAPEVAAALNREYAEWRYRRENDGSLTIYVLSREASADPMTALEVTDFLTQAIEPTYPGAVHVALDRRSYHEFTKADELSTHQINMEWVSHDEDGSAALPAS